MSFLPANLSADAPAQLGQFGGLPQVSPTYAQATTVDPNQNNAYLQQYEQQTATALAPQFQAQQQQQQEQSAARGLTGGAAQYGATQLAGQQDAAYAGAIAPIIQQGYGYTQQDLTGNAAALNANSQYNATTANNAAGTNAQYAYGAETGDANAYNQYQNSLFNAGSQYNNELLGSYLGTYAPSSAITGAYGQQIGSAGSGYNSAYGSTIQGQNQDIAGAFGAVGSAAGAGAFGGG